MRCEVVGLLWLLFWCDDFWYGGLVWVGIVESDGRGTLAEVCFVLRCECSD